MAQLCTFSLVVMQLKKKEKTDCADQLKKKRANWHSCPFISPPPPHFSFLFEPLSLLAKSGKRVDNDGGGCLLRRITAVPMMMFGCQGKSGALGLVPVTVCAQASTSSS